MCVDPTNFFPNLALKQMPKLVKPMAQSSAPPEAKFLQKLAINAGIVTERHLQGALDLLPPMGVAVWAAEL